MKLKFTEVSHYSDKIVILNPEKAKVFDHSDAWAPPSTLRSTYPPPHVIEPPVPRAWAGAPGAAHWEARSEKKILYPPPKWAVDVS